MPDLASHHPPKANQLLLHPVLQADARAASEEVLSALRRIIDPDFGEDIVSCGFVKSLNIDPSSGAVSFTLELTTPACPVKDQFKREATQYVQVSRRAGSSKRSWCQPGSSGSQTATAAVEQQHVMCAECYHLTAVVRIQYHSLYGHLIS